MKKRPCLLKALYVKTVVNLFQNLHGILLQALERNLDQLSLGHLRSLLEIVLHQHLIDLEDVFVEPFLINGL